MLRAIFPRRKEKNGQPLKPDEIFEFFKLPAELRDAIYEHLGETRCVFIDTTALRVRSHNIPALNLRLVNRQFRRELLKRTQSSSSIEYELDAPLWGGKDFLVPPLTRQVPRVAMHLPLLYDDRCFRHFDGDDDVYCMLAKTITHHWRFAQKLLPQFHQLEHASIELYLSHWGAMNPMPDEECQQMALRHRSAMARKIADFEEVVDIDVYLQNDETGDGRTVSGEKRLILTYSHEVGALVPVNVEKLKTGSVH